MAQNAPRGFHLDRPINMAAILAKKPSTAIGFSSVSEARSIINDIMDVSNIQQNFKVEATTQVDNAAAVIYQNIRYILYNPSFIDQLDNAARDKWASISVIGHEIGHHLLGHTLDGRGSQIPKELEADEYSGLVLRRMGASLQQAQLAMKLIASPYASATHPGEGDRLAAIAKGWNSTTMQPNRGNNDVAIGTPDDRRNPYPNGSETYPAPSNGGRTYPAPQDSRGSYPADPRRNPSGRSTYPSDDNRGNYPQTNDGTYGQRNRRRGGNGSSNVQLVYDIRFNGNNLQQYYITSQNEVIMLRGNQAVTVAKLASTNKSNYPYVIYDDRQQIFIDRNGNLFSENGRKIGYLLRHT
ncbi:MAG: hypothetical protein JWR87_785 [Segetibacter sp.]|nr:hypothetical protein [Segetibacter sp.]